MKQSLIVLASISMILAACSLTQKPLPTPPSPPATVVPTTSENKPTTPATTDTKTPTTTKSYTLEEVGQHSTGASCWLILDNKVYDVTTFIPKHPGGEAILRGCGKDATQMFSRHPESAKTMKEQFYIGDLKA